MGVNANEPTLVDLVMSLGELKLLGSGAHLLSSCALRAFETRSGLGLALLCNSSRERREKQADQMGGNAGERRRLSQATGMCFPFIGTKGAQERKNDLFLTWEPRPPTIEQPSLFQWPAASGGKRPRAGHRRSIGRGVPAFPASQPAKAMGVLNPELSV